MIDEREVLKRELERYTPEPGMAERVMRRRERKQRRQRIASGAVALAITGALVGAVIWTAREGSDRTQPGDPSPTIEPRHPGPVGLLGLPSEDAVPSSPTHGEVVMNFFFGHTIGDPGRFGLFLYEDGRVIWYRHGDRLAGLEPTGWIEQRLTPLGVQLVMADVHATGLFDRDLHLTSGHGLLFGDVQILNGERLVRVTWGDIGPDDVEQVSPTQDQARALIQLDARLLDLAQWLPAEAWVDPALRPFVPSRFEVCYTTERDIGLDGVIAQIPGRAGDLLRSWERTYEAVRGGADSPSGIDVWCSDVRTEQARTLARLLDDAGSERLDEAELAYVFEPDVLGSGEVSLSFDPVLPHDV